MGDRNRILALRGRIRFTQHIRASKIFCSARFVTMKTMLRVACICLGCCLLATAEGTRTWQQSRYDELEKGTARGVAIASEGGLSLAPEVSSLYTSPSSYLWGLASDADGAVYAAAGSPARVYKIARDGKASIIFAPQELSVQAVVVAPDGAIYAATSPDGRVYKIVHRGRAEEKTATAVDPSVDPSYEATPFFDPKSKYIWALAVDHHGNLYVGTGDRGEIDRVNPNGTGAVFFRSDEAQVRVLAFDKAENLIAGTDGSGLVYRISPQGEGFVLYSAPKKEITALAVDAAGAIYAAGVGEKRPPTPPAATTPAGPVPVVPPPVVIVPQAPPPAVGAAPAIAAAPFPNPANVGGSEVYRIARDGAPKTIWSSKEDVVYALALDQSGGLLAGTGNKGKLYTIRDNGYSDVAKASANQVTALLPAAAGGVYAATSNLGKVFFVGAKPVTEGTYESDVFDARIFSKWGRAEVRGWGSFELFVRSGNLDNPDRNWSAWKKVELARDLPADVPAARFVQWKTVLRAGDPAPKVEYVTLYYLPKNVAPEIDEVSVSVGARVPSSTRTSNTIAEAGAYEAPVPSVPDKRSIAVKWRAHDANDDQLVYNVYYRGDGEKQWKLLRDNLSDRYANLDSDLFPDGGYEVRIVASDEPSHSPSEALTAEKISDRFEVDNTPPRVEFTNMRLEANKVHLAFRATDSFSAISRAEYSIDAGDWQTVEPVGQISDYKVESYDLIVPLPSPAASKSDPADEHTIVVRVFDKYDNAGIAKTVVKTASGSSH